MPRRKSQPLPVAEPLVDRSVAAATAAAYMRFWRINTQVVGSALLALPLMQFAACSPALIATAWLSLHDEAAHGIVAANSRWLDALLDAQIETARDIGVLAAVGPVMPATSYDVVGSEPDTGRRRQAVVINFPNRRMPGA